MNNSFKKCQDLLKKFQNLEKDSRERGDIEGNHIKADELLCEVARSTTFNSKQRALLVEAYNKIDKYFA